MSLTEEFYTLKNNIDLLEKEIQQLSGGRKASASRSRKCLQNIKKQSFNMRKSITTHVKALPTKSRTKKVVLEVPNSKPVEAEPEVIAIESVSTATDNFLNKNCQKVVVEPEKPVKQRKPRQSKGLVMKRQL